MKPKDIIKAVNGKSVAGKTLTQAVSMMRGKIGTTVKLTIERSGQTFTVSLKRAKIPVTQFVFWNWCPGSKIWQLCSNYFTNCWYAS
ncbi:hypothetical protein WP50_38085 [Lactiplantibacillus plantarum]|nr:hypothetical protein WP50_38085 [Lactiplantibacillus plantarum]